MSATATPLVGRAAERATIAERLEAAAAGSPALVVLGGDAGVGKTRLVLEVAGLAEDDGWTVLTGGCVELAEGAATLAPVAAVLRQLARARGDDAAAALLRGPARWLALLVPELGVGTAELGDAPASQVLVSFHRLLRDLADDQPVLLVLEDLHWADATTRDLLLHLATRLHDERLLVLATVRTDDLDRRHPLRPVLAEVARRPDVVRLDLSPLDDQQITTHLATLAGDGHGVDLDAIAERAGGNPFFAEELLAAGSDGRLPPTLEDALLLRLERLPADTQQLLGEAAVLGAVVAPALLEQLTGLDPGAVRPAVRAALDDGVLQVQGDGYAFRHALLREIAEERLLPHERLAAHAAAATALEADPDLAVVGRAGVHGQIAHHWWEARDQQRCLVASVAAMHESEQSSAGAVALRHVRRALELWERVDAPAQVTGTTHPQLLLTAARLADAANDTGGRDLAVAAVAAAVAAGDDTTRAAAVTILTVALINRGLEAEALEVTTAELARHSAGERTATRSMALSADAMAREIHGERTPGTWDLDGVTALYDEALEIAQEVGDDDAEGRARFSRAQSLAPYLPSLYADAVVDGSSLAAPTDISPPDLVPMTYWARASIAIMCGDLALADTILEPWRELMAQPETPSFALTELLRWTVQVVTDTWFGRFDEIEAHIDDLDIRDHLADVRVFMLQDAGPWLRWTGRSERALGRARTIEATVGPGLLDAAIAAELAASLAAGGAPLEAVVAVVRRTGSVTVSRRLPVAVGSLVAAVAVAARDRAIDDDVLALVDGLVDQLADTVGWLPDGAPVRPWAMAWLQHARAERAFLAGAPDPDLWDPVVADFDERGGVPFAAAARLRRAAARAAVDGGSSPALEADLSAAWEALTDLGPTTLQDDARVLAGRLRIDLPGPAAADATSDVGSAAGPALTGRERDVLALVAEGWTNKQVGEHLFISPKTVSVHMTNAMRKLDVDNRTEAAAVARRAGLLDDD